MRKLTHRVVFPFELKLSNMTADSPNRDALYSLFAVVVHVGSGPHHGERITPPPPPPPPPFLFRGGGDGGWGGQQGVVVRGARVPPLAPLHWLRGLAGCWSAPVTHARAAVMLGAS